MSRKDPAALKQALAARMLALEEAELTAARDHYARFLRESRLDERESHDTTDLAEARENADLAAAFDHPVHAHQAKIEVIKSTDFAPTETVRPGAVVGFGGRNFVVCVATSKFECEGETYMGISPQSPIYRAMADLEAGDVFKFNGQDVEIETVI